MRMTLATATRVPWLGTMGHALTTRRRVCHHAISVGTVPAQVPNRCCLL